MPSEPNATCPICGASVFFWKNSAGSKVWFDALGAPWPKHPCLDNGLATTRLLQTATGVRSLTHDEIRNAQRAAEGPLPPTRLVTAVEPPETAGCLRILGVVLAMFLAICIVNWWRLVATGEHGVVGTLAATVAALAVIAACRPAFRRPSNTGLREAQAQWARSHPQPAKPWTPDSNP